MMGTILTVSGLTGGIGKTTVAVNLCAALALYEEKVLLVDCDPRAVATAWLGKTDATDGRHLSSILKKTADPGEAIVTTGLPWLDLVPAGFNLFTTARSLSREANGETLLKHGLHRHVRSLYEYIIIDSPPSFGFLSVLALTAGDGIIVPLYPDRTSDMDCRCLLKLIHYIRKTHHTRLRIAGFLVNACDHSRDIQAFLEKERLTRLSDLVFDTMIPDDPTVIQAMDHQVPVVLEDIKSPGGKAFLAFAKEIDSMSGHQGERCENGPCPENGTTASATEPPATEPPAVQASAAKVSIGEMEDIRKRSSGKVEQLAASIADMINEINQNEET